VVAQHLSEGELLYTGAKIKVEGNVASKSDRKQSKQLEELAPNPIVLFRDKPKFLQRLGKKKRISPLVKTKGEPPVLYSSRSRIHY
jgi:hypothetical protein